MTVDPMRHAAMLTMLDGLGAHVEAMGGGSSAWWIDLGTAADGQPAPGYALITDDSGLDHDNDPRRAIWMVGRYVTAEHGETAELHDGKTFWDACAIVRAWVEAAK